MRQAHTRIDNHPSPLIRDQTTMSIGTLNVHCEAQTILYMRIGVHVQLYFPSSFGAVAKVDPLL